MSTRADESILVRVERLERENRRLKRVLLLSAVLAAAGLMLAPSPPKKKPLETVKAREVQIVDDQGNARISMKLEANGDPVLALMGTKGSGARLALIGDRPVLALSDETRVRASLQITKDGAGLDLEDAEGKRSASMQAGGTLGFLLEDTGVGRAEGGLVIGAIGPAVVLSTPDESGVTEVLLQASRGTEPLITASRGLAAAKLDVSRDGGPSVTLSDAEGRDRAVLGVTKLQVERKKRGKVVEKQRTDPSSLVLFDAEETVIWRAP